ncbi:DsbA family protein [Agrobacterium vitis]
MNRRSLLGLIAATSSMTLLNPLFSTTVMAQTIDVKMVLHDPDSPENGNPKGDVTIVAFTDYNCPYCKKSAPDLKRIIAEDGKVRLVYKDWPILTKASVYGAKLALAAKYQGKYELVHDALMTIPGKQIPEGEMLDTVKRSGVDMNRLNADLKAHGNDIAAILKRNMDQADALGMQGTPTYLIGPFRTSTLDYDGFKQALLEARRRQAAGQGIAE